MQISIGYDHHGFDLKKHLISDFSDHKWLDLGPTTKDPVDFPDYADQVCMKVNRGEGIGLLICGTGQGMAMRANKYQQVRAAVCWNEEIAQFARLHNDANILCLPGKYVDFETASKILKVFLETEFEGGRHTPRVQKVNSTPK